MLTLVAFVVALGILIAVHEYGHYRVAVACGVKVLRFSIGFGPALLRWQPKGSPTEFVLSAFPLGGYVRMLDEREAEVPTEQRHLAFNTQPLRSRAAIERLGAKLDGVLRAHRRHKDGTLRDTYTYSITAPEWPAIRERLDARLTAG